MDLGLSGRRALVAAGSRGLGRASAEALLAEGARVAICGRDRDPLQAAASEIGAVPIVADVSTVEGALGLVQGGAEALGGCEILVPNSGGPPTARFGDLGDDDWQAAFELLLRSWARMIRAALPHMRAAGYGRVVGIGSSAMKQPIPNLILSNALRAGVAGMLRTLADEIAPEGITVNVVLPGRILTDRVRFMARDRSARSGRPEEDELRAIAGDIPMGRIGDPADVGAMVAYLASERAAYVTGAFVAVDGGLYRGLF